MILVDSKIPMHLVGADSSMKVDAGRLLERLAAARAKLVTDAEVLREILRRYVAIRRPDAIQPAFDALLGAVDDVLPIRAADVLRAREIVLGRPGMSARDALHVAVMQAHDIPKILSFDRGFDGVPGVERIS